MFFELSIAAVILLQIILFIVLQGDFFKLKEVIKNTLINNKNDEQVNRLLQEGFASQRQEIMGLFSNLTNQLSSRLSESIGASEKQIFGISRLLEQELKSNEEKSERADEQLLMLVKNNAQENAVSWQQTKDTLFQFLRSFKDDLEVRLNGNVAQQKDSLELFAGNLKSLTEKNEQLLNSMRDKMEEKLQGFAETTGSVAKAQREELKNSLDDLSLRLKNALTDYSLQQSEKMNDFSAKLQNFSKLFEEKSEKLQVSVQEKLQGLQKDNSEKLEQMRQTVDEKLHATLEKRLGDSFKIVSERLEQVHKGLGEMQTLAVGVGDLKKVLSNVKTRGIMGEYQLENILEQILAPEQYAKNVKPVPDKDNVVEFAIKLPGNDTAPCYLPLDAKFPVADYQTLVDAWEVSDTTTQLSAHKAIMARIKQQAKDIKEKYISPPYTTDFAIMFLPIEGLYAEVLRDSALVETLQRDYHIVIAGPNTLAALLHSLQVGFKTLAISKRSSEVWELLSKVKTEFGKFGSVLDKTRDKLEKAVKDFDHLGTRTRAINRQLRTVQELPEEANNPLAIE